MVLKSVSSLNAQYAQQTGRVGENTGQLNANWRALGKQFTSLQEVNDARTALMSQSARFIHMNQSEQNELIQLGATLKQVGVDMQAFAQTVNLLQVGFNMNTKEIAAFENRLHALGQQVGFSTMQINRDWVQSQAVLAKYGRASEQVFDGLTRASKETGLATSQLIGITDQFNTFEGAADIVGKFNALLGGPYLNTIQMVYAKDHERLALLRQIFKQSRLNWQDMQFHEKMAYASAAGIRDMAMAAQLWGTTDTEFARINREQKELADLARESREVLERFSQSMMRLAVATEPLLNVLAKLADWLANVLPASTSGMTTLVLSLGAAYTGLNLSLRYMMTSAIQAAGVQRALSAATIQVTAATGAESAAIGGQVAIIQANTTATWSNVAAKRALIGLAGAAIGTGVGYAVSKKKGKTAGILAGAASGALGGAAIGAVMGGGVPGAIVGGTLGAVGGAVGTYYAAPERMQGGGRTRRSGPVIVGDRRDRNLRGAEIIAPKGTNVINSQQTGEILAASQMNQEAMSTLVAALGRMGSRLEALTANISSMRAQRSDNREVEKTVIMQVDGNTLGSVVVDVLKDRHELGLVST
jgi:hypothetical protein